ncbi:MAG: transposase [Nitrososphaerota archaeon]|jgi:hypothetical protein|nr:transposase [Nitrososphaerota archaeon]
MYIGYDIKNGIKYAKICKSQRINGKVKTTQTSLGRVIDEKNNIYQNRKQGIFTYDINTGIYSTLDPTTITPTIKRKNTQEKQILDFGDAFFVDCYINKIGLTSAIKTLKYANQDSIKTLLTFYILCNMTNYNAMEWYNGNYAHLLYPKANIENQHINELLTAIGNETSHYAFFNEYSKLLTHKEEDINVLIDYTGLPNSIHFPLTAVSEQSGQISNEIRLVYAVQQGTNLPLYFRYATENITDNSTLTNPLLELKALNIGTKFAILNAEYLTEKNVKETLDSNISFVSRLRSNQTLHREIVAKHLPTLKCKENFVYYNTRYAYIKRVDCEIVPGHWGYAYLGLDLTWSSMGAPKLFERAKRKNLSTIDVHRQISTHGVFVFVSTSPIDIDKILPLYYIRQQIFQVFDVRKNNINFLPLRIQSEDALRGHLLLAFIAAVFFRRLQEDLGDLECTAEGALLALRNQKCKVFDGYVLTMEATKQANDIYKRFKIKVDDLYVQNTFCN